MKTKIGMKQLLSMPLVLMLFLMSCKKEISSNVSSDNSDALQAAVSANQAVAVAASFATPGDSIYVLGTCPRGAKRDLVAFSALPSVVGTYLSANYSGYTFLKAFKIDSAGVTTGHIVIISFNSNPVGLKFDASGNFVTVLEQREGHDLRDGRSWHEGGCFGDRDGLHRDSIALSALPSSITAYFAANYPQDTLKKAFRNRDSSIVVISINNGVFATVFSSTGTFISRNSLPVPQCRETPIDQSALPAGVQSYLSTTYPNYVFKFAFSITQAGTLKGYVVLIDANNTRYAVQFDAAGNFVRAVTVH